MTRPATPEYVSRKELCRRLSISPSTVYRHGVQDYALLIGNAVRYNWAAIVEAYRLQPDTENNG